MKPIVKWVGGKRQLIDDLIINLPNQKIEAYYEPFFGGGALLWELLNRNIIDINTEIHINDLNPNLYNLYTQISTNLEDVLSHATLLQDDFNTNITKQKEIYLNIRKLFNSNATSLCEKASIFLFLNKACFNGLYRVNKKGEFNVPIGSNTNIKLFDEENIRSISEVLKRINITNADFQLPLNTNKKMFVYFDPPYRPISTSASFTSYTKEGFNDDSQRLLKEYCDLLHSKGHMWMLSNSDESHLPNGDMFFEKLYDGYNMQRVYARRSINSNGDKRGKVPEILIRNYE